MPQSPIRTISFNYPPAFAPHNDPQNQSLSIPQQCEQRLAAVTAPDLSSYLPRCGSRDAETLRAAVSSFKQSPIFSDFKNSLLNDLKYFQELDPQQANLAFEQSDWGRFAGRLELIPTHADDSPFRTETYQLYYLSCPSLQRMRVMLNLADEFMARFSPSVKQELIQHIRQLRPGLSVCDPGVIQNISSTFDAMHHVLLPPDLTRLFQDTRIQIARAHFQEMVRSTLSQNPLFAGNEIHMVAAFQNHFAHKFNLPVIDDIYASKDYVRQSRILEIELDLAMRNLLAPDNVCNTMARNVMDRLKTEMSPLQTNPFDVQKFNQALNDNLENLAFTLGPVSTYLVCELDENLLPARISHNPTLLALELLRKLRQAPGLEFTDSSVLIHSIPLVGDTSKQVDLKISNALVWIEEKQGEHTEQRLLNLKDLTPGNMRKIFQHMPDIKDPLLSIAYEALRNCELPGMQFFREIELPVFADEPQGAALVAAYTVLNKEGNQYTTVSQYLQKKMGPNNCARLLLSGAVDLLSREQQDVLRLKISPSECFVHASLRDRTFQQFVLNLDSHPELGLYKASPWLFKSVLQSTNPAVLQLSGFRIRWATDENPAYLRIAREHPVLQPLLTPLELMPVLIEEQNRHNPKALPAIVGTVAELTSTEAAESNFTNLMKKMLESSIPDWNCAGLLHSLLDKNSMQQMADPATANPANSLLGLALSNCKPQSAMVVLNHESTMIFENTHQEIRELFRRMQAGVPDFQEVKQVLEALVNKGVRLDMPD